MTPLLLTADRAERLDQFLSRELGLTRSAVQKLLVRRQRHPAEGAEAFQQLRQRHRPAQPGQPAVDAPVKGGHPVVAGEPPLGLVQPLRLLGGVEAEDLSVPGEAVPVPVLEDQKAAVPEGVGGKLIGGDQKLGAGVVLHRALVQVQQGEL